MKIKTQRDALALLLAIGRDIDHQVKRYESSASGAQTRAKAASSIAGAYADRASVHRQLAGLFRGDTAKGLMAITAADAEMAAMTSRATWLNIAQREQAEADRIARQTYPAFAVPPEPTRNLVGERARRYRQQARHLHGVPDLDGAS
jgi:hypothetical protein